MLITYWDYLKHFGREKGRKKWKEHKSQRVWEAQREVNKIINERIDRQIKGEEDEKKN